MHISNPGLKPTTKKKNISCKQAERAIKNYRIKVGDILTFDSDPKELKVIAVIAENEHDDWKKHS